MSSKIVPVMKDELSQYSDQFILGQVDYFSKHLLSGNHADRLLINGCLLRYEQEARRRGLIK